MISKAVVVFVADDNYVHPLLHAIHNAVLRAQRNHQYVIFTEGFSPSNLKLIQSQTRMLDVSVEVERIPIDRSHFDNGHISRASMIRLKIPDYVQQNFVYLDLDLLLKSGWDEVIGNIPRQHVLGARRHWGMEEVDWMRSSNHAVKRSQGRYFNAGVLTVNYDLWKLRGWSNKVSEATQQYSELGFQWSDQCILNYVAEGNYEQLPEMYNCNAGERIIGSPVIIHFAGSQKPWSLSLFGFLSGSLRYLINRTVMKDFISQRRYRDFFVSFVERMATIHRYGFHLFSFWSSWSRACSVVARSKENHPEISDST